MKKKFILFAGLLIATACVNAQQQKSIWDQLSDFFSNIGEQMEEFFSGEKKALVTKPETTQKPTDLESATSETSTTTPPAIEKTETKTVLDTLTADTAADTTTLETATSETTPPGAEKTETLTTDTTTITPDTATSIDTSLTGIEATTGAGIGTAAPIQVSTAAQKTDLKQGKIKGALAVAGSAIEGKTTKDLPLQTTKSSKTAAKQAGLETKTNGNGNGPTATASTQNGEEEVETQGFWSTLTTPYETQI